MKGDIFDEAVTVRREVAEEILEIMTVATTGCARSPRFRDFTIEMGE